AVYVPAPDHKALAISHSRLGMITGQADIETAKNGALENCRNAVEAARIENKCELYAVGNTVVYQGGHPHMTPLPTVLSDTSVQQQVHSAIKLWYSIIGGRKELCAWPQIKGAGTVASSTRLLEPWVTD